MAAGDPVGRQPNPEYLERLIAETVRVYEATARQLEQALSAPAATSFQKFRASQLLKQVRQAKLVLDAQALSVAERGIPYAYKFGTDIAGKQLGAMGLRPDVGMGNRLQTASVQALTESIVQDLMGANQSIDDTVKKAIRATKQAVLREDAISRTLVEGIATGDTRRSVSKRLEQQLEEALNGGKWVQAGTRRFKPSDYAELVTRTRTREAVTEGSVNSGLAAGCDLVQVSVHDGACPVCLAYQGKVYSIDGSNEDFPKLESRPPYHPRCRHVLAPVTSRHLKRRGQYDALSELSQSKEQVIDPAAYKDYIEPRKTAPVTGARPQRPGALPQLTPTVSAPMSRDQSRAVVEQPTPAIERAAASLTSGLSPSEKRATTVYTNRAIANTLNRNAYLHGIGIAELDSALASDALPGVDGWLARKITVDADDMQQRMRDWKTGKRSVETWPAYSSTSMDPSATAGNFTYIIRSRGRQGAYIAHLSAFPEEKEVLFQRYSSFRVTGWDESSDGSVVIFLDELDPEQAAESQAAPLRVDFDSFLAAWKRLLEQGESQVGLRLEDYLR